MKQLYIFSFFFILCSFNGIGQTFQWDTENTIDTNLNLNTYDQYPMYQSALGNDTVTLAIEVIHNDLPATWDGMLCIYGMCLGTIPAVGVQATMNPITGSEQGMVRLTVNPFNETQTAKLQVYVYDVDFPNDGDTATWLLNTTASTKELNFTNFTVHPNPVINDLQINSETKLDFIEVYSLSGTLVKQFDDNLKMLDFSDVESGYYLLNLVGNDGSRATHKIQKL
jgi:hypothetical protein